MAGALQSEEFRVGQIHLIRHFENFFKAMHPPLLDREEAFIWSSQLPHPAYNLVAHSVCPAETDAWVDHTAQKFSPAVPHSWWIHSENRADGLKEALLQRGYQFLTTCPVLTWQVAEVGETRFDVRKASDMSAFADILTITSDYEPSLGKELTRLLDNNHFEHYVGYLEDQPVGIVTLFRDGKTGVVSNLATLQEHQRKGCGRALMLTLMKRAGELGLEQLVLGTSPAAEKLYQSLHFTTALDIDMYFKPA